MSEVATLIADMVREGVDPEIIGRTAQLLSEREPVKVTDEQAERRRAKDRERKRLRNSAESAEENKEKEKRTKKEKETLSSQKKNPPKGGQKEKGSSQLPDGLKTEVWQAYLDHRGKKFTENAQRLALGKLERWLADGHDPNEIIETSIMNGWKGLFEPDSEQRKGKHHGNTGYTGQRKPTVAEVVAQANREVDRITGCDEDGERDGGTMLRGAECLRQDDRAAWIDHQSVPDGAGRLPPG